MKQNIDQKHNLNQKHNVNQKHDVNQKHNVMGWTDIFKSKSERQQPDPRLRWFGKIPSYPDYHSSNVDEKWVVEFNDWILKGYEKYQSRVIESRAPRELIPLGACAIRLPENEMTVLASLLDFGGDSRNRPFPICFYAAIPSAQWSGPTANNVSSALTVLENLQSFKRDVARLLNTPGDNHQMDSFADREIPLDRIHNDHTNDAWVRDARLIPFQHWLESIAPAIPDSTPGQWLTALSGWGANITTLEGPDFEPTFRFPLAAGIPQDVQIASWLHWLEKRMDLSRRCVSLIITGDIPSHGGYLCVIARPLMSDDFILLTPQATDLPFVDDAATAKTLERDPSQDEASSTPASLYDFVSATPPTH